MTPALPLQKAIHDALAGHDALTSIIGGRKIYDSVPENAELPYVVIGEDQITNDGAGCSGGWEAFVTVHVWGEPHGRAKAKRIGAAVSHALSEPLVVEGFHVALQTFESEHYLIDADGITPHGIITWRYLIEEI